MRLPGRGFLRAPLLCGGGGGGCCGTWPLPQLCPLPSMLGPLEGMTADPALAQHTLDFGHRADTRNTTPAPTAGAERHPSAPGLPLKACDPRTSHLQVKANLHPTGSPSSSCGGFSWEQGDPEAPHQRWLPGPPPWHPGCHSPSRWCHSPWLQQADSKPVSSLAHSLVQE